LVVCLSGYKTYFDKSPDDSFTVVAGFVSSVEQWAIWEEKWKAVLRHFQVPYFHMREFTSCREAFSAEKWKDNDYRKDFIVSLVDITKKYTIRSFGGLIEHTIYNVANKMFEVDKFFNPFAACGRDCALRVNNFIRQEYKSNLPIAYIFEQGDEGKGMLIDLMIQSALPAPIFKRSRPDLNNPKLDEDDPPAIQLQAADLLSWEIRRWKNDYVNKKKMRKSLKSFIEMPKINWKECDCTGMARLIHSIDIPKRK